MISQDFLSRLPKISLHDHLDGAVRPETLLELSPAARGSHQDADSLRTWIEANSESGSLERYLSSFSVIGPALQTAESLQRVAAEYVEDLVTDGVVYAEVRWAPEAHLAGDLDPATAIDAVQRGLDDGCTRAAASGYQIDVRQILTALRHQSASLEIAKLAIEHRGASVVAFDLAGPEAGYPASLHRPALDLLASELMPVTIHAGEGDGVASVRSAVLDGRAIRLGHGVRIADDILLSSVEADGSSMGQLARWVLDRQVVLELSPTSNWQTGAFRHRGVQFESHPFDLLYRLGFAVTVNPDNRTLSSTTVTRELQRLSSSFGYEETDLLNFELNAASAAFLPHHHKVELIERIAAFGATWESDEATLIESQGARQ